MQQCIAKLLHSKTVHDNIFPVLKWTSLVCFISLWIKLESSTARPFKWKPGPKIFSPRLVYAYRKIHLHHFIKYSRKYTTECIIFNKEKILNPWSKSCNCRCTCIVFVKLHNKVFPLKNLSVWSELFCVVWLYHTLNVYDTINKLQYSKHSVTVHVV